MNALRSMRLQRLRAHARRLAEIALARAARERAEAEEMLRAERRRRADAERREAGATAVPRPVHLWLQGQRQLGERCEAERLAEIRVRRLLRTEQLRRGALHLARVREEQMQALSDAAAGAERRAALAAEQKALDDLRPRGGGDL